MTDIPRGSALDATPGDTCDRPGPWSQANAGASALARSHQSSAAHRPDPRTMCGPRTIQAAQRQGRLGGVER